MIKFFNTLTRQLEEFKPIKKNRAGMYTCGPTVYNFAHIGNLRAYVFDDILKRVLSYNGYKVKHVMNITDVGHLTSDADVGEDKMEKGALREGKTAWDLAKFYEDAFKRDLQELNILEPDIWCRATEHIKDQIKLVKKLEKKGYTYETADGIYFDTSKLADYGKLANLKNQELRAGVRVDIGDKKNTTDFALWKFSPKLEKRQMEWGSPWGLGFPGWHIECSAMSEKYLKQPFDIHCGGIDHIPVHHTNEIAQSEAANGKPLANYWLHNEFLNIIGGEKMAKSGENFLTISEVKRKNISPLAYRYFLLQTHYRKQLTFTWEALQAAENGLKHLYHAALEIKDTVIAKEEKENLKNKFLECINNDLDTPSALALVWETIKDKEIDLATLLDFDQVFGLNIKNKLAEHTEPLADEITKIITARNEARENKNWALSDELRQKIEKLGYEVKDGKNGTEVTKK